MKSLFRQYDHQFPARRLLLAGLLALGALISFHATAAMPLEAWRNGIAGLRAKAENDASQAYLEAQLLQKESPAAATSADRARMLNLLARIELYLGLIDRASQHSAEAGSIAKQGNDRAGQIEANLVVAASAINQGRLEDMVDATRDSMNLLVGLDREDLRAEVMFHVAMMYLRFGQLDEAATVAMQSLDIARRSKNPQALAYAEQGMASVYAQSARYAEAREHYLRMREAALRAHSVLLEAGAVLGLSGADYVLGNAVAGERQNLEAIALFRQAGGPLYVGHAMFQLADHYLTGKQPAKALPLLDGNVAIYEKHANPIGLWWTLNKRSAVLQELGRLAAARGDAERAHGLARQLGFTVYLAGSARRLSEVAAAQGDYKRAYRLSAEAAELAGKLEREKSGQRILELAKRFQEESKQRKIDELNRQSERQHTRQRQLLIVLAATAALLGITVFFLLRLRRSREEIKALNAGLEQRVLERTSELFENRQSLAEAQRIVHVGSWEMNLADNVLTWSDEIYRIFEVDPGEFGASYEAFMEMVHPDDRELLDRTYKTSLERREHFEIEHRLLLPDGRIKFVHERCETLYDAGGKPLRSIGTVQDITERKRMEAALQESKARYRDNYHLLQAIIESPSSSVAIYAIDREYRLLAFNNRFKNAAKRLWNAEIEPGMSVLDAIDTEAHREFFKQGAASVLAGNHGHLESTEDRIEDGRLVREYHDNFGSPIYNDHGDVIGMTIFVLNTTERKEAELKLKEALEFTEGIINAIPDILFEVDREGRYLNVWTQNPELLAAQKELLLGKTAAEVLSPENAAAAMRAIREADEQGASRIEDICIELPQGRRWFSHSLSKKPGGAVGKATFLVLSRDITERKRLEAELRDSRNFLDSVIDAVPDPIFVKDRQHRWILLNDANCRFTGLPRESLIGKSDYDVFPREEADVFWEKDELVFESGDVNLNEESFTSANGEKHYIQTKKTPFVSADGSQMLVGVIRDITERKRYEAAREAALAEARRLAELRSEFIAHMSHELRTPLNGILGYAQMLERDGRLDGKQQASMEVIRQSGEHLLALIEDILDLARIESGRLELDIGDIPLARFLDVVAGMVGIRARQKHLEFVCEFAPDLPQGIRGDEKRLRQVLLNLLSNAVKFTDQGKVVWRVERLASSRLAFTVADTGIGIASADREKIFQSFEQVSDARRRIGGTGLGLAISRQLVRLMGGDIEVESRMGEGSTFRFELELPESSIEPAAPYAASAGTLQIEPSGEDETAEPLVAPPREEMLELHRLALLGNMRDIVQFAERIKGEDSRYRPFAERLCQLAEGYQSKAILAFVEGFSK
ncbi:MAG TPA: PAS domain-containing protein [Gallionella sp.]|nr:PAS domain-containing protein [Gallionella sp.]